MPSQLDQVGVEITVLLGRALMPMQQLLRMGRGAVIQLDTHEDDKVWILANNHPIARGELVIENDKISVNITGPAEVADTSRLSNRPGFRWLFDLRTVSDFRTSQSCKPGLYGALAPACGRGGIGRRTTLRW